MELSIKNLENLTPQEALIRIQNNRSTKLGSNHEILYSHNKANTFEEFQKTLFVVNPESFKQSIDMDDKQLALIESFYVYGAHIVASGMVGGDYIEKHKDNGGFVCVIAGDYICTDDLNKAEKYLYEQWYKDECI